MKKLYRLGVDIGGTKVQACLFSVLNGSEIELDRQIKYKTEAVLINGIDSLRPLLAKINNDLEVNFSQLDRVGLAINCAVSEGIVQHSSIMGEQSRGFNLKELLVTCYPGVSNTVENDVHAMAIAEIYYGETRDCRNILFINLGTGIRLVPIINNSIFRGYSNQAGEISPIKFFSKYIKDWLPSDQYAAGRSIPLITARSANLTTSAKDFFINDKLNTDLLDVFIEQLEEVIWSATLFYNPEKIIFGGSLSKSYSKWLPRLKAKYDSRPYNFLKAKELLISKVNHSACMGVVTLNSIMKIDN